MEVLIIETDPLVRDRVKVGLQQFPEINVTCGEGYASVNQLRQRLFDCVFLGIDPRGSDGVGLLEHMRSFDETTEVVVMTTERHARDIQHLKSKLGIGGFLHVPVEVAEFFQLAARLRRRTSPAQSTRG